MSLIVPPAVTRPSARVYPVDWIQYDKELKSQARSVQVYRLRADEVQSYRWFRRGQGDSCKRIL
jgi:hypothetical protein